MAAGRGAVEDRYLKNIRRKYEKYEKCEKYEKSMKRDKISKDNGYSGLVGRDERIFRRGKRECEKL